MRDLESLIHQTLHHVIAKDLMPMEKRQTVEQTLLDREKKVSMAIGNATAVPPRILMF